MLVISSGVLSGTGRFSYRFWLLAVLPNDGLQPHILEKGKLVVRPGRKAKGRGGTTAAAAWLPKGSSDAESIRAAGLGETETMTRQAVHCLRRLGNESQRSLNVSAPRVVSNPILVS